MDRTRLDPGSRLSHVVDGPKNSIVYDEFGNGGGIVKIVPNEVTELNSLGILEDACWNLPCISANLRVSV
jgi:hypothetical protein